MCFKKNTIILWGHIQQYIQPHIYMKAKTHNCRYMKRHSFALSLSHTHTQMHAHMLWARMNAGLSLITALLLWSVLQLMCVLLARCWINCVMPSLGKCRAPQSLCSPQYFLPALVQGNTCTHMHSHLQVCIMHTHAATHHSLWAHKLMQLEQSSPH